MILGDLLGLPVFGPSSVSSGPGEYDGGRLGKVADARFVLDGQPHQLTSDARLLGLIVSPHSSGSFLGYERTEVRHPWPLPQLLRWRHRGSFLVLWEDIAFIGRGEVRLRDGFTAYSTALARPE